jgi:hypothetical protein
VLRAAMGAARSIEPAGWKPGPIRWRACGCLLPLAMGWAAMAVPTRARAEPLLSLHGGNPLAPGEVALSTSVGWPGVGTGLHWGLANGVAMGLEVMGLVGSPWMGFEVGAGGMASVPLRLRVARTGRWSLAWALAAGGMLGEFSLLGGRAQQDERWGGAVLVDTRVAAGLDVSSAFTLAMDLGGSGAWIGRPHGRLDPWAATATGRLVAEGRLRPDTLLFLRCEAGLGFADPGRFGNRGIFRWFFGAAFLL